MRGLAVGALLLAASCGTLPGAPSSLANTEWRVTAINGRATPTGPVAYSMRFEGRQLDARFGCNIIGGTWRATRTTLVTDGVVMTEMACSEPASTFESEGAKILSETMAIAENGDRMTLGNAFGTIELVRAP